MKKPSSPDDEAKSSQRAKIPQSKIKATASRRSVKHEGKLFEETAFLSQKSKSRKEHEGSQVSGNAGARERKSEESEKGQGKNRNPK